MRGTKLGIEVSEDQRAPLTHPLMCVQLCLCGKGFQARSFHYYLIVEIKIFIKDKQKVPPEAGNM